MSTPPPPPLPVFADALVRHQHRHVGLDTDVLRLMAVLSALQLALRHPHFPARLRGYVNEFVADSIAVLGAMDPVLCHAMELGNALAQGLARGRGGPAS